ncbi:MULTISPECIES: methyl-accepting chemotaxis protein [Pseudanabaena]|jgi:methyl-accepting chemotaxis protein PixJ|uniref:methyl-accepting chemotaxis protein n=1 Tax=Pseudanabaena TaxID=1152 RepID=UPI002478E92E|nr:MULTISPECIES: methyl-accepting chemotaxis protein [Pseudanabaena]MEA5489745.1 methyl-accepting chemotaxis protein [Pseudanabaena sp. CCNP1317]WGS73903.1 methyl-accepting chemotaxis protein [Pseudanabaena galeata CCNP1313]
MLIQDKPEIPPSENPEPILPQKSITRISLPERASSILHPKTPLWKLPAQVWNNWSVRWKLSIVLLLASGLPVLIVTQILVKSSEQASLRELRISVQEKGSFFVSEYVLWTNNESKQDAEAIAKALESNSFDLNDANELAAKRSILQPLLQVSGEGVEPESIKNIKLITDSRGRSIEGNILVLDEDFSKFPLLASRDQRNQLELIPQLYKRGSIPTGRNLANLPIVKNAIATGQPMYGIELVKSSDLQALGLEKPANIGIRPQAIQGLAENKQPAPAGTYDIEQGKSGLISMAVYPIKVKGRIVGTAVVGSLLNRNYGIVDKFSKRYNMPTATIFAQDWRVATNVPYVDPNTKNPDNTRAIGTRSAREVSDAVLQQGQEYVGETNITGINYLTFYAPLYDHRKLIDGNAKPVGIAYVGRPLSEIQELVGTLSNAGYAIAGISILVAGAIGIIVAISFARPLRILSSFTQKIGTGEISERLTDSDRRDEIGTLSQELNNMAEQLEVLIAEKQLEAERIAEARQEAAQSEAELRIQEQKQAKEFIQKRALELLIEVDPISRGDLTIRAKVTEDEIGTIADSYNATIRNLRKLVTEVQSASQSVSQTVLQNQPTMQNVSDGVSEQMLAIAETLERIQTLTELISGVEMRAIQAEAQVKSANQALLEGDAAMNSTVEGFTAIRDTVSETAEKVQQLGEASQKISKVVKLISGFASQTNMLALNASIEAARAGEEGQGFGVVANEVRALAQRSAKATTEIRQLIEEIQAQVNDLVKAMAVGTKQVNSGSQLVEETRQKLTDISASSQQVNQLVREIAQAAALQSQTSTQASQTIQNVATIASSNSSYTQNLNDAFSQLLKVAEELQVSVAQFKVNA